VLQQQQQAQQASENQKEKGPTTGNLSDYDT
jgi:hypothetical protein